MDVTPEISTASVLSLGFLLGLRHATEADHLAAVSTIVSQRRSLLSSSVVGGLWGIGHTLSLLLVGCLVIFAKLQISPATESWLESLVGAMLIILGVNALVNLASSRAVHVHQHDHDGHVHTHLHVHRKEEPQTPHHRFSSRSVAVGMVHGLAGSAALMLLVVPVLSTPLIAVIYIVLFGLGSIGGMMIMSFLIGLPFHLTARKFNVLNKGIRAISGLASILLGALIFAKIVLA